MSDNNCPNDNDKYTARTGLMTQLALVKFIKEYEGSIDEAIDFYGMRGFLENTIQVIATEKMWHRLTQNLLHEAL